MTAPIEPREMSAGELHDARTIAATEPMIAPQVLLRVLQHAEFVRIQELNAQSELVTERAAHAETQGELRDAINEAESARLASAAENTLRLEAVAAANQLQADIDAEIEWRLSYRKKHGAAEDETMMGFLDRLAAERDSAIAAANRHLACTAKAVAELEEAKGRVGELEQCLRPARRQMGTPADWACAECKPHSDTLEPGFLCWFHMPLAGAGAKPREARQGEDADGDILACDHGNGTTECGACFEYRRANEPAGGEHPGCSLSTNPGQTPCNAHFPPPVAKQAEGRPGEKELSRGELLHTWLRDDWRKNPGVAVRNMLHTDAALRERAKAAEQEAAEMRELFDQGSASRDSSESSYYSVRDHRDELARQLDSEAKQHKTTNEERKAALERIAQLEAERDSGGERRTQYRIELREYDHDLYASQWFDDVAAARRWKTPAQHPTDNRALVKVTEIREVIETTPPLSAAAVEVGK